MSVNKVIILGKLGKDPELKYTANSNPVCKFTVATSETWKDKSGQKQTKTEWHNIVVWGKQAESCNTYLSKGRDVFLEGAIETRSYEDKNGVKKYITEINAKRVQFVGSADKKATQEPATMQDMQKELQVETKAEFTTADIPF